MSKKIYFFITLASVFFVYFFSLFRPWQPFDERLLYNETLFPIPACLYEIPEIIKAFVLNYHMESMNSFFSNFMTIRSNPIAEILVVIVSFFFKKSAFLYHLLQLTIHLINTALMWTILDKIANSQTEVKSTPIKYFLISMFTLIWALHSANTEAVLLITNWKTIMTYTFCLCFILFEAKKILKDDFEINKPGIQSLSIATLFCLTMFTTEYGYSLPLIMFFLMLGLVYKKINSTVKTFLIACKISLPYFAGLFFYYLLSLLRTVPPSVNLTSNISSIYCFIERNLWLTPQLFVHLFKIILFPIQLSTYQSNLTTLGDTLLGPYPVFCMCFYIAFLLCPIILFILYRRKTFAFIFLLIYAFYFALFPNLHILLPTYCLSADRYVYLPSILLIILLFQITNLLPKKNLKPTITILICVFMCFSFRTIIRISEWNNPAALYKSAINLDKNPLYKGQKLIVFADYAGATGDRTLFEKLLLESLNYLSQSLKDLEDKVNRFQNQPLTLKIYGLDYESLLLKTAYAITTIKNDNFQESPDKTLPFYEPYIKDRLNLAGINQIVLYTEILLKAHEIKKAKDVLEYGLKKFPYSADLLFTLSDLYLTYTKDLKSGYVVLQKAYNLFPNQQRFLHKLYKYYEETNDLENQARFAYLIGLRDHSKEAYKKASEIYTGLNQPELAQKAFRKLQMLNKSYN